MAREDIQALPTIQYFRGDTNRCAFLRTVNDAAIDISGYTYLMTVSRLNSPDAGDAAANQIMQLAGTVEPDQVSNRGVFDFAPLSSSYDQIQDADFIETPSGSGVLLASLWYDIQETSSGGEVTTLGKGAFQVLMDITK